MYRAWKVWFKYSDNIYCTNICYGKYEEVENHYQKYEILGIEEATTCNIYEAELKGMPIIKL